MKKVLFLLIAMLLLTSCEMNGCSNETVEFGHSGVLTYYLDEDPLEALKDIKLKVTNKGKETIYSLNDKNIKIDKFAFDEIGEYTSVVTFNNKTYSLKYKVEVRKWDGKTNVDWYNEAKDSFELSTANELAGLAELVKNGNDFTGKTVKLKYDVDLNNLSWMPIGTNGVGEYNEVNKYFSGTFDGNSHTVYNLYTKAQHANAGEHLDAASSYYHFGLFGYVKNASIKNVNIQNVDIVNGMGNGYVRSLQGTAALVGYTSGEVLIENVKVLGNISIKGEYKVGGLVGSSSGTSITIKNAYVRGSKNSFIGGTDEEYNDTNNFGGLVGFSATSKTMIENVISDIDVDGYTSGGIIGNVVEGTLELKNASVYGNISNKEGSVVGGFVGGRFVPMTLSNCYFVGSVSSKDKTYADVCVSKYGDTGLVISVNEVYYNSSNFDDEKVQNTLNIIGKTKEELESLLPSTLK